MKERIFYYDVLKAFSIFIVIMGHILFFSFRESDNIIWRFIDVVNMAMFMFVSGLLSGKPSLSGCKAKIRTLLLPTVIVGIIYTFIKGLSIPSFFTNGLHFGYWFCLTLWMYHVLNYLIFKVSDLLRLTGAYQRGVLLWTVTVMLSIISRIVPYDNSIVQALSLHSFFKFLPYFAYGVTLNIIPELKKGIETNNIVYSISLILLILATYFAIGYTLGNIIIAICYINVMVYFFNHICKNRRNKSIEYVAKRTLDIYLFHYFLLPAFIVEIPAVFNPDTNILYTLIIVILLSALVLCGTLIITKLIECSKLLSYLMLGKRSK